MSIIIKTPNLCSEACKAESKINSSNLSQIKIAYSTLRWRN